MSIKTVSQYEFSSKVLGKGSFGTVIKAYDRRANRHVAVKTIQLRSLDYKGECVYANEIETLANLKGENVVKLLDAIEDESYLYLFLEYCNGGSLEDLIHRKEKLSERQVCSFIKQIARAFLDQAYLQEGTHKKVSMMHRDVKPANILIHNGKIKVADFGFAKFINDQDKNTKKRYGLSGTPLYSSPQVLSGKAYSSKCDIWATGVMFFELLAGDLPWKGYSENNIFYNICYKPIPYLAHVRKETRNLINRMLQFNEEDRVSWEEVYSASDNCMSMLEKENREFSNDSQTVVQTEKGVNQQKERDYYRMKNPGKLKDNKQDPQYRKVLQVPLVEVKELCEYQQKAHQNVGTKNNGIFCLRNF